MRSVALLSGMPPNMTWTLMWKQTVSASEHSSHVAGVPERSLYQLITELGTRTRAKIWPTQASQYVCVLSVAKLRQTVIRSDCIQAYGRAVPIFKLNGQKWPTPAPQTQLYPYGLNRGLPSGGQFPLQCWRQVIPSQCGDNSLGRKGRITVGPSRCHGGMIVILSGEHLPSLCPEIPDYVIAKSPLVQLALGKLIGDNYSDWE